MTRAHTLPRRSQACGRLLPDRLGSQAIDNHHFNPCRLKLAEEQGLMLASARQAVRRLDVHTIDASMGNQLAQAIQAGTSQRYAAIALVNELSLSRYPELILHDLAAPKDRPIE